jgi:hypothetical protein
LFKNDSIQRLKENFNYVNSSFQRKYEGGMNASFDKKTELTLSLSLYWIIVLKIKSKSTINKNLIWGGGLI